MKISYSLVIIIVIICLFIVSFATPGWLCLSNNYKPPQPFSCDDNDKSNNYICDPFSGCIANMSPGINGKTCKNCKEGCETLSKNQCFYNIFSSKFHFNNTETIIRIVGTILLLIPSILIIISCITLQKKNIKASRILMITSFSIGITLLILMGITFFGSNNIRSPWNSQNMDSSITKLGYSYYIYLVAVLFISIPYGLTYKK